MSKNKKIIIILIIILLCIGVILGIFLFHGSEKNAKNITLSQPNNKTGKIIIEVSPAGSMVDIASIDSSYFAQKEPPFEIEIPIGKYMLSTWRNHYGYYQESFEIKKDEVKKFNIQLTKTEQDIEEGAPTGMGKNGKGLNNLIPNP